MTAGEAAKPEIRRVMVALDNSRESLAALDFATALASWPDAELVGLFVEDVNILHAAGLPFSREINISTGDRGHFDPASVERGFRAEAEEARKALSSRARARRIRHSFSVRRGNVAREIVAAALGTDMIVIGKCTRALSRLGSTSRQVASRAAVTCIVTAGTRPTPVRSVMVYFDGTACAQKALAFASRLASRDDGDLTVLIPGRDAKTARDLADRARQGLGEKNMATRFLVLERSDPAHLARAVHETGGGVLVLGGDCPALSDQALDKLLRAVDCPVLIVRTGTESR